jgi:hypothetical protein
LEFVLRGGWPRGGTVLPSWFSGENHASRANELTGPGNASATKAVGNIAEHCLASAQSMFSFCLSLGCPVRYGPASGEDGDLREDCRPPNYAVGNSFWIHFLGLTQGLQTGGVPQWFHMRVILPSQQQNSD